MLNSRQNKYQESHQNTNKWNEEVDVIVIGSGFAGLAAAISARQMGASVIVLEKRSNCGGNSVFSDGLLARVNPNLQLENGLTDSPDLLRQDMLRAGRGYSDEKLVNIVAHQANEVFQWLVEDIGCCFQDRVDQFGGHSVPRSYTPCEESGKGIINPMLAKFKNLDGKIKHNTIEKPYFDHNTMCYLGADNPDFEWQDDYINDVKTKQLPAYLKQEKNKQKFHVKS